MKKISTLITATILVIFIMPAFAGKPTPTPVYKKTVISDYFTFEFEDSATQVTDFLLLTVPEGKTFILTDLDGNVRTCANSFVSCELFENDALKYPGFRILTGGVYTGDYSTNYSKSFISGIPFTAGSTVHISVTYETVEPTAGSWFYSGDLFWSGYLIDN